jgi:hypothetical protein
MEEKSGIDIVASRVGNYGASFALVELRRTTVCFQQLVMVVASIEFYTSFTINIASSKLIL